MDNFNFYEFFNSKDIANHCKNIGHTFTSLEMAYIIWHSEYHTLEQKHTAWQYLIDHYPDEELPEGKWLDDDGEAIRKERSLHKFLQHYIEIEQQFLEDFSRTRDGYIYDYAIMYSGEDRYQSDEVFYDSYDACFAALQEDMEKYTVGVRITRRRLYSVPREDGWDEESIHMNADLGVTFINSMKLDEDWVIKDGFTDMWFHIPTPFQLGDLVTCNRVDKEKQEKFVLLHIPYWEENERGRSMKWYTDRLAKEGGDWTDMQTSIYKVDQDGDVFWAHGPNYLFLEYCQDAPEGNEIILFALSSYLQNKISLEDFLCAQKFLIAERQITELYKYFGPADDIKALCGLIHNDDDFHFSNGKWEPLPF